MKQEIKCMFGIHDYGQWEETALLKRIFLSTFEVMGRVRVCKFCKKRQIEE